MALGASGTWLAIGSDGGTHGQIPVYRSTDGRSWEEVSVYESSRSSLRPLALAHGGSRWLMLVWDCAGAALCGVRPLASVDQGRQWHPTTDDPGPQRGLDGEVPLGLAAMAGPLGIAHDGKRWAVVGPQRPRPKPSAGANTSAPTGGEGTSRKTRGRMSTSPTGHVWTETKGSPDLPVLTAATFSHGLWVAAAGPADVGEAGDGSPQASIDGASVRMWSSRDLRTWTPAGSVAAPVRDVTVFDPRATPPGTGRPTGTRADAALRIDADALRTVPVKGETTRAFAYDHGPLALTKWLRDRFGPPADRREILGDGMCSRDETVLHWDGLSVMFPGEDPSTATSFHVTHDLTWAVEDDLRRVRGPKGIGLGTLRTEVDRAAPNTGSFEYDGVLTVLLAEGEPHSGAGVVAELTQDRVTALHAPQALVNDC
ncbi:hypothetical protein [Streptomyces sp. NPDC096142]|uniref:hypothetical protein n=1 Tax=Streptomyces sp. NPDC096142 TaxID=3366077 RepID=UPI0037F6D557